MQLDLTEYLLYFFYKGVFLNGQDNLKINSVPPSFVSPAKFISTFSVLSLTLLMTVTEAQAGARNPGTSSFLLTANCCFYWVPVIHLFWPYFSNFFMKMSCKCQNPNQTDMGSVLSTRPVPYWRRKSSYLAWLICDRCMLTALIPWLSSRC